MIPVCFRSSHAVTALEFGGTAPATVGPVRTQGRSSLRKFFAVPPNSFASLLRALIRMEEMRATGFYHARIADCSG